MQIACPRASLAAVLLTVVVVCLAAASPAAAKTCSVVGQERKLGPTYVTKLAATNIRCASALKVVKAYHSCRYRKGRAGRCTSRVLGFACTEKRSAKIPTQYTGVATCKKGSAKIVHTYTQYT